MSLSTEQLTTLRDAAYQSALDCLSGKDVMFEGQRVTLDDIETLFDMVNKIDRQLSRMQGRGFTANNVGILRKR